MRTSLNKFQIYEIARVTVFSILSFLLIRMYIQEITDYKVDIIKLLL